MILQPVVWDGFHSRMKLALIVRWHDWHLLDAARCICNSWVYIIHRRSGSRDKGHNPFKPRMSYWIKSIGRKWGNVCFVIFSRCMNHGYKSWKRNTNHPRQRTALTKSISTDHAVLGRFRNDAIDEAPSRDCLYFPPEWGDDAPPSKVKWIHQPLVLSRHDVICGDMRPRRWRFHGQLRICNIGGYRRSDGCRWRRIFAKNEIN